MRRDRRHRRRRRWVRWVIAVPIILVVLVALWGTLDATGGATSETVYNYRWETETGTTLGGYLIRPETADRLVNEPATGLSVDVSRSPDGRYPAVLLIHEWWGLNLEFARMAEQLAADGYIVLAPDAFRGKLSVSVPGALTQLVTTPTEQIHADLDRALEELRGMEDVDPDRVAVAGFCFGGTQAMQMGSRNGTIAATTIFYGGGPFQEPDQLGALGRSGPLLGIYGAEDATIPVDEVERFEEILTANGVETQFSIYEEVGHAFVNPRTIRRDGAAAAAWNEFRAFLAEEL